VRFRRPAAIDLGGIAKGFAVDRAVDAMRCEGAASGVVNAGGDLRVFGGEPSLLHVRHPREPGRLLPAGALRDAAFATSADTFARRRWRGRAVSPLLDPTSGRPCVRARSASVRAPTCLVADALTKVVMILGRRSAPILRAHAASGFWITAQGDVRSCEAA
jgi:FAD:protein FMN transferase